MKEESREKIRQYNLSVGKRPPSRLGITPSEETRKKQSLSMKKNGHIPPSALGKKRSEDFKKKTKKNHARHWLGKSGEGTPNWRGGVYPWHLRLRKSFEGRKWIKECMSRDGFACQKCGRIGGFLNVHHRISFVELLDLNNIKTYEDGVNCLLLWDIKNGETLCVECHTKTENYGRKTKKLKA